LNVIFISSLCLFFSSIYFAIIYYKKLIQLNKEFNENKHSIEIIIDNYLRSIKKQEHIIEKLKLNFELLHSSYEKNNITLDQLSQNYINLSNYLKNISKIKPKPNVYKFKSKKDPMKVIEQQKNHKISIETKGILNITDPDIINSNITEKLTDTERYIIQILLYEEDISAPKIQKKIEKTREHTARLMRKLYSEGYVERSTHKIPYTYRLNKNIKDNLKISFT
jgi:hypothetical protein